MGWNSAPLRTGAYSRTLFASVVVRAALAMPRHANQNPLWRPGAPCGIEFASVAIRAGSPIAELALRSAFRLEVRLDEPQPLVDAARHLGEQVLRVLLVARQAQGRHVFHGLPIQSVELLVGRRDLRGHLLPVRQALSGFQLVVGVRAILGSGLYLVVGHKVVFAAGVPGAPRRQIDFKTDAA